MKNWILLIKCKVQKATDKITGTKRNVITCPKTGETVKLPF